MVLSAANFGKILDDNIVKSKEHEKYHNRVC